MASKSERRVRLAARAIVLCERPDLVGDGRQASRLRMLIEGISCGGGEVDQAVRRDAPVHPGYRERSGRLDWRSRRESSGAQVWQVEVRNLADDSGCARSP